MPTFFSSIDILPVPSPAVTLLRTVSSSTAFKGWRAAFTVRPAFTGWPWRAAASLRYVIRLISSVLSWGGGRPPLFGRAFRAGYPHSRQTASVSAFSGVTIPACWRYYSRLLALLSLLAGVIIPACRHPLRGAHRVFSDFFRHYVLTGGRFSIILLPNNKDKDALKGPIQKIINDKK